MEGAAEKKAVPEVNTPQNSGDNMALDESQALANREDLEKLEKTKAHTRRETIKDNLHVAIVILLWVFFIIFVVIVLIWTWHILTPAKYHFLDEAAIANIQSHVLTAVISGAFSIALKNKYFD